MPICIFKIRKGFVSFVGFVNWDTILELQPASVFFVTSGFNLTS